ncbi:uncharacterized protein LOC124207471 [Daphnia pulex]|uniref:uncharacterized protein LOC124207471 n=1 Tax=Daphnia pulex TaxID=6669 RepID=UPI001EDF9275|nr:uncharacterized protein LOC124207471 [Daphnia pulex]XP_046460903.1 uncharacterized protein LOC124207471 [Daphnia pulex]XP_046460904.1 uncharacterized protein LOC124207471 [Daphnia pulex]XP_046460906.1 uncharacterized protein LOC124207471 [Daphnia pulex]XP_046460907.1 uncharacterized protein LOC124207471 [Daphnia pulex]XP_046460908.1 uncharacterized protein LOC124207471 [Daphnia pulex]XP_046460909.1 uncharacterized protein LOC124207471 [Daphnia pulex]XP_046460910.1 uncharacterized protein 
MLGALRPADFILSPHSKIKVNPAFLTFQFDFKQFNIRISAFPPICSAMASDGVNHFGDNTDETSLCADSDQHFKILGLNVPVFRAVAGSIGVVILCAVTAIIVVCCCRRKKPPTTSAGAAAASGNKGRLVDDGNQQQKRIANLLSSCVQRFCCRNADGLPRAPAKRIFSAQNLMRARRLEPLVLHVKTSTAVSGVKKRRRTRALARRNQRQRQRHVRPEREVLTCVKTTITPPHTSRVPKVLRRSRATPNGQTGTPADIRRRRPERLKRPSKPRLRPPRAPKESRRKKELLPRAKLIINRWQQQQPKRRMRKPSRQQNSFK